MSRTVYWALIVSGLLNSAWMLEALIRGRGWFAVACGAIAATSLLLAACIGDEIDGT